MASFTANADEKLKDIACRSVHLVYSAKPAAVFYNEVTIEKSAEGTYFCVCGWNKGYFGIQELGNGKKLAIFSVWDSNQNNPKDVPADKRVKLLHKDEKVRIGRFGGEGTGGQSFFDYDWQIGTTYRFLVAAHPAGDRTEYSGYFYLPETRVWKHLVTFSTLTPEKKLTGLYSFVEDFKRDRISTTKIREARYGNSWFRESDGPWQAITAARFSADSNPSQSINAGVRQDRFFLATGGGTTNANAKLKDTIHLSKNVKLVRPDNLPQLK